MHIFWFVSSSSELLFPKCFYVTGICLTNGPLTPGIYVSLLIKTGCATLRPESALVDDHASELYIHFFLHGELFIIPQISLHKAAPEIATLCTFPKLEQNYCLQLHRAFHKPASVFVNTHFSVCSGFQRNRASTVSVSCVTKSRAPL